MNSQTAAVILAAGKGKRIGGRLPKPLHPLAGKPMIHYSIETLDRVPIEKIYIVVGTKALDLRMSIGNRATYVYQKEQLGTGHALQISLDQLDPSIQTILVIYGDDSAFYETSTLREFLTYHGNSQNRISLISYQSNDPKGLGRIVRDQKGNLQKIVEEKDASTEEQGIKEVNAGCYLIDVAWAREHIHEIECSSQGEYYLTDIVEIALKEEISVGIFPLPNAEEWKGVNTNEQLAVAHQAMLKKLKKMHTFTTTFIDFDNTLINTEAMKKYIPETIYSRVKTSIGCVDDKDSFLTRYNMLYEEVREENNFVNIPELCERISDHFGLSTPDLIKTILYTIPFKSFILPGVREMLEFLSQWTRVVIFADGDLVFEPMKIKGMELGTLYHDVYVTENKSDIIHDLLDIYDSPQILAIDDQVQNLEMFNNEKASINTIWLKQGPYQSNKPSSANYTPTFTVNSLPQAVIELKQSVFAWA